MPDNPRPFTPVPKPEPKAKAKPKPIKQRSAKRAKDDKVYLKLRSEYLEHNPLCEARLMKCTGVSTEIHHTHSGTDRNKYYLITPTWLAVCRNCHNEIHDNPKQAKTLGYLK
jgi:hypothetical protein